MWTRSSVGVLDGVRYWGSASPSWRGGGGSMPRKLVIGSQQRVIFQHRLGGGRWKDRAQQRQGRRPRRLGPQAPLRGLENGALGRQGILECSAPPNAPSSCSSAKDTWGHPAPARSQSAGHLRDAKPQFPAEPRVPVSLPPPFRPGGHGVHLERGEAGLGQRADPSGRAVSRTADLPPPPHPGARRSCYR